LIELPLCCANRVLLTTLPLVIQVNATKDEHHTKVMELSEKLLASTHRIEEMESRDPEKRIALHVAQKTATDAQAEAEQLRHSLNTKLTALEERGGEVIQLTERVSELEATLTTEEAIQGDLATQLAESMEYTGELEEKLRDLFPQVGELEEQLIEGEQEVLRVADLASSRTEQAEKAETAMEDMRQAVTEMTSTLGRERSLSAARSKAASLSWFAQLLWQQRRIAMLRFVADWKGRCVDESQVERQVVTLEAAALRVEALEEDKAGLKTKVQTLEGVINELTTVHESNSDDAMDWVSLVERKEAEITQLKDSVSKLTVAQQALVQHAQQSKDTHAKLNKQLQDEKEVFKGDPEVAALPAKLVKEREVFQKEEAIAVEALATSKSVVAQRESQLKAANQELSLLQKQITKLQFDRNRLFDALKQLDGVLNRSVADVPGSGSSIGNPPPHHSEALVESAEASDWINIIKKKDGQISELKTQVASLSTAQEALVLREQTIVSEHVKQISELEERRRQLEGSVQKAASHVAQVEEYRQAAEEAAAAAVELLERNAILESHAASVQKKHEDRTAKKAEFVQVLQGTVAELSQEIQRRDQEADEVADLLEAALSSGVKVVPAMDPLDDAFEAQRVDDPLDDAFEDDAEELELASSQLELASSQLTLRESTLEAEKVEVVEIERAASPEDPQRLLERLQEAEAAAYTARKEAHTAQEVVSTALEKAQADVATHAEALEASEAQAEALQTEVNRLQEVIMNLTTSEQELENELKNSRHELDKICSESDQLQSELEAARQTQAHKDSPQAAQNELTRSRAESVALHDELERTKDELQSEEEHEARAIIAEARVTRLEADLAALTQELFDTREESEAALAQTMSSAVEQASSVVRPPATPKHELDSEMEKMAQALQEATAMCQSQASQLKESEQELQRLTTRLEEEKFEINPSLEKSSVLWGEQKVTKYCTQCGEGTVKPDREACKKCGGSTWTSKKKKGQADEDTEAELMAAESRVEDQREKLDDLQHELKDTRVQLEV